MNRILLLLSCIIAVNSWAGYVGETPSFTSVQAGNIKASANTVISTDANGAINLAPNGTGGVAISTGTDAVSLTTVASTAATSTTGTVFNINRTTVNDMVDGFGSRLQFTVADNAIGPTTLGRLGFLRGGADNKGDFFVQTANGGGATEKMRLFASGSLAINNSIEDSSALLDLTSTTRGLLPPRMTTAQRDAIASPATGLVVYNTSTTKPNYYSGAAWVEYGGVVSAKSQAISSTPLEEIQVPNNLLTETAAKKFLVEMGNKNLLANPSFEHTSLATSWTITGGGTPASSSTNLHDGLRSLTNTSTGAWTFKQASSLYATAKSGNNAEGSIWFQTSSTLGNVWLCPLINGTSVSSASVENGCMNYTNFGAPQKLTVFPLFGGTSTGVELIGATAITYLVDDAYVGDRSDTAFGPKNVNWTNFGAFTADTTLFGQGTMTGSGSTPCKYRQDGSTLHVQCAFTGGTVAATLGAMLLPTGYTIDTSRIINTNNTGASGDVVGRYSTNGASSLGNIVTATGTATDRVYMAGTFNNAAMTAPVNVSAFIGSSAKWTLNYSVPVLDGDTGAFTTKCSDPRLCATNFSWQVSSAGVVSNENFDIVNGNCVYASNEWTCTYNSSILTQGMNCAINVTDDSSGSSVRAVVSTNTTLKFKPVFDGTSLHQKPVSVVCSKGTVDTQSSFVSQQIIQSRGVSITPGASSNLEIFSASYGTTNATTVCSASPCSYLDQIGNAVTSITRASGGNYTFNVAKTYSKLKCTANAFANATIQALLNETMQCSSCSSIVFATVRRDNGATIDTTGVITCQGQY